jgi:hypothetical protein
VRLRERKKNFQTGSLEDCMPQQTKTTTGGKCDWYKSSAKKVAKLDLTKDMKGQATLALILHHVEHKFKIVERSGKILKKCFTTFTQKVSTA